MSTDLVVYTRPRCPYSFRLRRGLRRRGLPFVEVDIRAHSDAAAAVRAHAAGNEVVPTVRIGERWLINPTVDQVCNAAGMSPARRTFRITRARRIGDAIAGLFARVGIGPLYLLTTRGRRTGLTRTVPVTLVERDGRRWLVAPYGAVSWVHNARAAGTVTLRRGHKIADYRVDELPLEEAAPILKQYLRLATATRPYFSATADSPVAAFEAEAHRHPVFTLTPAPRADLGPTSTHRGICDRRINPEGRKEAGQR